MNLQEFLDKIQELVKKPIFLKIAAAAGIILMIIIALSDISGEDSEREPRPADKISFESADIYAAGTEERLCAMLSEIEGVGKAKVMLTIRSTEEYVYAETQKISP